MNNNNNNINNNNQEAMDKMSDEATATVSSSGLNPYTDPSVASVLQCVTAESNAFAPYDDKIHLYHFATSLCSQVTRLVLEEKQLPYESHHVTIVAGVHEQYEPDYVRLNRRCVVPTLVTPTGKVTTDTTNIMFYLESKEFTSSSVGIKNSTSSDMHNSIHLMPPTSNPKEQALVKQFVALGDGVACEVLTFGTIPGAPPLPSPYRHLVKGTHEQAAKELRQLIDVHKDDNYLRDSYQGKLDLILINQDMMEQPLKLKAVMDATHAAMEQLNQQLVNGPFSTTPNNQGWLCSDHQYTLADCQWAVVLYRFKFRNIADLFYASQYPAIVAYTERLWARPAFQKAVVKWEQKHVVVPYLIRSKLRKRFQQHNNNNNKSSLVVMAASAVVVVAALWQLGRHRQSGR
ncbi:Glutathione S-transferase, C-terminal domain [Seminavis robusta]|uniref:Glutathione S-transferase, C-terminal domain n=1 Tax=Seminavis robusta TaxID=568900 RepID=A0A9N8ET00_9STRA|nr:Glutathione S-transferase, C-terminal domain [Seminavis robusta]|eukprot:Sro1547_g281470.1 Glutathione S-transferase, C-terminal domain (403) ;mRNA; r:3761-4969